MEPHRRGEATEAIVLAELKQRDIAVSHPFGDNERYDAAIEAPDGELLKVQIKTGWKKNGCIRFHTKTQHTNSTGHVYKPYGDGVDYFVVYSPDTEEFYLVGEDEFDDNIWLRVDEPDQEKRTINWASEYRFDERWPPSDEQDSHEDVDDCCQAVLDANNIPFVRAPADASFEFLVTTPNDSVFRVASTAGWVTEGRVRFNPSDDYSEDVVDLILVYCEETGSVYLVESSEFETSISLRVEDPERDRGDVKLADKYEFANRWDEVVSG